MKWETQTTASDQRLTDVFGTLMDKTITSERGAELLGLSVRQVRRKLARFRADGIAGVPRGNRNRRPHNALGDDKAARALLAVRDGVEIGRSTLQ